MTSLFTSKVPEEANCFTQNHLRIQFLYKLIANMQ